MRLLLLTLLFVLLASPCLAFVEGPRTHVWLDDSTITANPIGKKGNTYASLAGGSPSDKFSKTASGSLGRGIFKYGKFMNAAGRLSGWGNLAYAAIQLAQMYKDKKLQDNPALRNALRDATGLGPSNNLSPGSSVETSCGLRRIVGPSHDSPPTCGSKSEVGKLKCTRDTVYISVETHSGAFCDQFGHSVEVIYKTFPTEPAEQPENDALPDELSDDQLKNFVNHLHDLLQRNNELAEEIADALDDIISRNPEYLDWAPFSAQEFEDGMLQGKLEDAIQQRETATDPATQSQLDDLIGRLSDRINRNELERQRREEREQGQEEQEPQEEPFNPPAVPEAELKAIDFQPIVDLKGKMMTKFPFKLLTAFGSAVDVLKANPVAPSCEIKLGFGDPIVLDLSVLDSTAAFIRDVMSFLIFGACGFVCFRMWTRF